MIEPVASTFHLSPQGQADRTWLVEKFGDRFRGPWLTTEDDWEVELVRVDGRASWAFGDTPEKALAKARSTVESATRNRKVS
jgi:hypothetical protein